MEVIIYILLDDNVFYSIQLQIFPPLGAEGKISGAPEPPHDADGFFVVSKFIQRIGCLDFVEKLEKRNLVDFELFDYLNCGVLEEWNCCRFS